MVDVCNAADGKGIQIADMRERVLLIQDNEDCTEIMRLILEEEGFEVTCLTAIEELDNVLPFDLFIVDEFSHGKTGCEICRKLKTEDLNIDRPVLLSSTGIGLEHVSANCKADSYLSKPFDINYFADLVKALLSGHAPFK
jgi:two-component system response regulator VicR